MNLIAHGTCALACLASSCRAVDRGQDCDSSANQARELATPEVEICRPPEFVVGAKWDVHYRVTMYGGNNESDSALVPCVVHYEVVEDTRAR